MRAPPIQSSDNKVFVSQTGDTPVQTAPVEEKTRPKLADKDQQVASTAGAKVTLLSAEEPPSLGDLAKLRTSGHEQTKKRNALTSLATEAATAAALEHSPGAAVTGSHPLLQGFGEVVGTAIGVIVTEALALNPIWNAPLLDAQGQPVQRIEGADRIGDHRLRKRHQKVLGPKITAYVKTLPPGVVHDLLQGLGDGASKAPGKSYRLEVAIADAG